MHGRDHLPGGSDPLPIELPMAVLWSATPGSGDATGTLVANQTSNVDFAHYATNAAAKFTQVDSSHIEVVAAGQYLIAGSAFVVSGVESDLFPAVPTLNKTPGGPYLQTWTKFDPFSASGIGAVAWGLGQFDAGTSIAFTIQNINVSTSYTINQRSLYVVALARAF